MARIEVSGVGRKVAMRRDDIAAPTVLPYSI